MPGQDAPWDGAGDRGGMGALGAQAQWQRAHNGRQYVPPGFGTEQDDLDMREQGGWGRSQPAWMESSASAVRRAPQPRQPTPSQTLRAAMRQWMGLVAADVAFTIGFGVLGGVIGGCAWYAVATQFHFELGLFGLPMAYLIGKGIAMGAGRRGFLACGLALLLTLFGWVIVLNALQGQGFGLTVLDGVAWFIGCMCTLLPILQLPGKGD
jgi:hypothetical protein